MPVVVSSDAREFYSLENFCDKYAEHFFEDDEDFEIEDLISSLNERGYDFYIYE